MDIKRKQPRTAVDIAVILTTVLNSLDARIIDLSEHGAQIMGASMDTGAKFQIEYMGQTVYAQCMWSEVDRMGVRFPFDLTDGPLHEAMVMATAMATAGSASHDAAVGGGFIPALPGHAAPAQRRLGTAFGRRSQA